MSASIPREEALAAARKAPATGRTARSGPRVPRWLALLHRWLGIGMCLFFAMWFTSGIVMMFVPYPSLDPAARYRGVPALDMRMVRLAPGDALTRLGLHNQTIERLILLPRPVGEASRYTAMDHPTYVIWSLHNRARVIDAATGAILPLLEADGARFQAERFAGGMARTVNGPCGDDQWTVAQGYAPYRPLWRVDLADSAGSEVYVSAISGEIVLATTRMERIANYAGSVAHWIYPTLLRRYPGFWANTVWCLSGIGVVLALSGMVLGILRSMISLRNMRRPRLSPFLRTHRLHHLLGLSAGLFLTTWIISGWLSVDHGLIFPTGQPDADQSRAYQGRSLEAAVGEIAISALNRIAGPSALRFTSVGGMTIVEGSDASGIRTTWNAHGDRLAFVPDVTLLHAAAAAWPLARPTRVDAISPDDLYGHLIYQGLPEGAVRMRLGNIHGLPGSTWVDVDRTSGALLDVMDWRRRLYRWLFNGLHTFDVPGLSHHGVLRRLIMAPILLAGLALSVTGIIIGMKRLRVQPRRLR